MKRETLLNLALVLALTLVWIGQSTVVLPASAQEPVPQDPVQNIQAALGAEFTYQGRLTNNTTGDPIAGPCDFQFSLWDATGGGTQIGSTQTKTNVTLSNGYFSTSLDFGATAFQGEARYLQIAVGCPAGGGYTPLTGRVALTGTPYAHSLRPGATVSSAATSGRAFGAVASATSGDPAGLYGEANASSGAGVAGWNLASSGGYGLYGRATGSTGAPYGVYGYASHVGSATSYGVYGRSESSSGTGVGGVAPMSGVYGQATGASGSGVYGTAPHTSGTNYGVYGRTASPNGYGVYATNTAPVGASGEPTALYATLNSTNGFAIAGVNNSGRGLYGQGSGRYGVGGFSDTREGVFGWGNTGLYGRGDYTGTYSIAMANSGTSYGVYADATANSSGIGVRGRGGSTADGVYGSGLTGVRGRGSVIGVVGTASDTSGYAVGVFGESVSSGGTGGRFTNMYTAGSNENAVGLWAGSYYGDIIQGHELDSNGSSTNRRFRVTYQGNVYADGTYSSPAADFAEMLPATGDLEPGDVLVIGLDGRLMCSSAAYQPTVVGVYSTEPGFLGGMQDGEDMEGQVPLAVVGVVPVKASAENGPIQPGDMLVASALPGHAMRAGASPPVGTVIGKALAGLDSDTGVILMLVVLQ